MSPSALTPQDLYKLIPQALPVAYWLKERAPDGVGDLLAKSSSTSADRECLTQLLSALEATDWNLTNSQLRYVLDNYKPPVWAIALQNIVCNAHPSLIPAPVQKELLAGTGSINFSALNRLGYVTSNVLGEVFSGLRDGSKDYKRNAAFLAPKLFQFVDATPQRKLQVLIELIREADKYFGQSAAYMGSVSFGIRPKLNDVQWNLVHTLPPDKKRRQDLRTFYSFVDKRYVGIVEDLFSSHSFPEIALAINIKYGMLPTPWKTDLQRMKTIEKTPGLEWFQYDQILTPTPGKSNQGAGSPRNRPAKENLYLSPRQNQITQTDVLVNRFIDTEYVFHRGMKKLANTYVTQLFKMSRSNHETQQNLMLTYDDIESIFGQRYQKILEWSESLLYLLEPINLLRTKVRKKEGREGVLATVLNTLVPNELYNHFLVYSETYPSVYALVENKLRKRNILIQRGRKSSAPDFIDLWEEAKLKVPSMKNKSFADMLMVPVNRVREYRKMIMDIMKTVPKNSIPYPLLHKAYQGLSKAATDLSDVSKSAVAELQS